MANVLAVGWIVSALFLLQCGRKPELPLDFHSERLSAPTELTHELSDGHVILRWTMPDTTNVARYIVSVSDSSGLLDERFFRDPYAEFAFPSGDSVSYYFRVRAVDGDLFEGPSSSIDSLVVP
jgi:hypothetical protein